METIIIAIITFILGYITGIYLPQKFRKEDRTPKIFIGPFQEKQNYFDITNHGGDILNFSIGIWWLQNGKEQKRTLDDFFNAGENPAFGDSHKCNSLKRGDVKKVIHCPLYSDDGRIKVVILGEDIDGRKYSEKSILKNKIKG